MSNKRYLLGIISLFLMVRLIDIGRDISNTDAYRWHIRSQDFLAALKEGDLKSTYQHYQPGVTLMWVNAAIKQAAFTVQYHGLGIKEPKTLENADWYPVIHGMSKAVLVIILCGLLVVQMMLVNHLYDLRTAYLYGFFMAFEPYLIGMDRWFHLTSLETYLGFTSFLFLLWWRKDPQPKKLVSSGIFFALSVLSKMTTLLTAPIYPLVLARKNYSITLKNIMILVISAVLTFFMLFPALLANPIFVSNQLLSAGSNIATSSNQGVAYRTFVGIFFYYLVLLLKLSPIILALFAGAIIKFRKVFSDRSAMYTLLYIIIYFVALTLAQKKIDRYILAVFPSVILLGTLFTNSLSGKWIRITLASSGVFLIVTMLIYHPVYSAYYSPLLGGTITARKLGIYDNSGEYFAQSAFYLNNKGRDVKVFVPHGEASFDYYFKGERVHSLEEQPDYIVVSLDVDRDIENYGCEKLEARAGSREADIVYIFDCR